MSSSLQDLARDFAERVTRRGVAKMPPRHAENATFRTYVGNALGAGQYVSFWHENSYVYMTRDGINEILAEVRGL